MYLHAERTNQKTYDPKRYDTYGKHEPLNREKGFWKTPTN